MDNNNTNKGLRTVKIFTTIRMSFLQNKQVPTWKYLTKVLILTYLEQISEN